MPLGPLEHCTYFSGLDTAAGTAAPVDSGSTVSEELKLLLPCHTGHQVPVGAGH